MIATLTDFSTLCKKRLESHFQLYLNNPQHIASELQAAMDYGVQNGGKRIRPLLVYATGQLFDTPWENLDAAACAIELIHSYSLIHDDLPAMDDSDLRRGKPSCHKAFNDATAILAGDALQPLAFEILCTHPCNLSAKQRVDMIHILSTASGIAGMAGGQALDLAGANTIESLNEMYQRKTGALLTASVQLALIASNIHETHIKEALEHYIKNIGLAFQIQDDLLDIQSNSLITGKPQGIDSVNQKITYPILLGIEKTEAMIQQLFHSAVHSLDVLGGKAILLHEIAQYLIQRKN